MRILITGATGLIGSAIVRCAHGLNLHINYLTTSKDKISDSPGYTGYYWNPRNDIIDEACIEGVGAIIHLAGKSIFTRWTESNKQKIRNSRIQGANLLFELLKRKEHVVGQFVSASGISIYPSSLKKMYYEDSPEVAGTFLGELTRDWEAAADQFSSLGLRVAKIRTGMVLSSEGGALEQIRRPIEYGVGSPLGSGKQWQSWIHLEDLAKLYIYVVINGLEGVYNAVAPDPVTNEELTKEIARDLGKKIRLPNIPEFALKMILGKMSQLALESQLVSSDKIQGTGFEFKFVNLKKALHDFI